MKKENRLLKNNEFKNVLDTRISVACGEFVIYCCKNNLNRFRIGISVSSKLGNSVVRHKIKRRISEMIKDIFDVSKNVDIVIIARKKFLENNFVNNKKILEKMLKKLMKEDKSNEKN